MRFLVDQQLPPSLATFLARDEHSCQHVQDLGLETATDRDIWERASADGSVLVSKDEDFLDLALRRPGGAKLLWVRLGNCRKSTLLEAFERLWPGILERLDGGDRVVEIR